MAVVALKVKEPNKEKSNELFDILIDLANKAKSGQITGVAGVVIYEDGKSFMGCLGSCADTPTATYVELLSLVDRLSS